MIGNPGGPPCLILCRVAVVVSQRESIELEQLEV